MGDRGVGDDDTLSSPEFPVRLSHCKGTSLPKPPREVWDSGTFGLNDMGDKVESIQRAGRLPTDPPGPNSGYEGVTRVWPFNATDKLDPDISELLSMHCSWCVLDCGEAVCPRKADMFSGR
jgi:hypothetical protein